MRDAVIAWLVENQPGFLWALPVVAETYDGTLNDINGFHVRPEHVFAALDGAASGPVTEGAVGGGTGMNCNGFKGGIGTASRRLSEAEGGWTVGVLVQCNYGTQPGLRIAGVPVGRELAPGRCRDDSVTPTRDWVTRVPACDDGGERSEEEHGSIIVVVATDAPLLPVQLERVAQRVTLGLGALGSIASTFSGDLFLAFSTANSGLAGPEPATVTMWPNNRIDPIFRATAEATEEAVVNAMVAAETMTGADGVRSRRLPHDELRDVLRRYNRLAE